jgi:pilus assembly protein Flp/PilA
MQFMKQFIREEEGQDVLEYGLVLGLVALAGIAVLAALGGQVSTVMTGVQDTFNTALAGTPFDPAAPAG